jgi:acyl-CoA synthetase (AMP-forming)/AMP-acid ligase II
MIFDREATNPDGLALDDLTRQRTWAELVDRSTRIAHLFREEFGLRRHRCRSPLARLGAVSSTA